MMRMGRWKRGKERGGKERRVLSSDEIHLFLSRLPLRPMDTVLVYNALHHHNLRSSLPLLNSHPHPT